MSTTTEATAHAEQVARTAPLGIYAVAQHMIDRKLPAPMSITRPGIGEREVALLVYSTDLDVWTQSFTVDDTADEPCSVRGRVRRVVHGRLDNGIRILMHSVVHADPRCQGDGGECGALVGSLVEPGCGHGHDLCAAHRHECTECVDEFRQDRTAASQ